MLVVARGDELFGNEIHAVVQARHNAGIRRPEELEDFVGLMMADDEDNSFVRGGAMPRIDISCHPLGLFPQRAVGRTPRSPFRR